VSRRPNPIPEVEEWRRTRPKDWRQRSWEHEAARCCPRHASDDPCGRACHRRRRRSGTDIYGAQIEVTLSRLRFAQDLIKWDEDSAYSWAALAEAEAEAQRREHPEEVRRYLLEKVEANRQHVEALDEAAEHTTDERARDAWHHAELVLADLLARADAANRSEADLTRSLLLGDRAVKTEERLAALLGILGDGDACPDETPPSDLGPPGRLVAVASCQPTGPPAWRAGVAA
jgi:hypothetical protein